MLWIRCVTAGVVAAALLALVGCPGGSTGGGVASPVIGSIVPAGVPVGSGATMITVDGSSFVSGATVNYNGSSRATTFVSASQLTAQLTASDISSTGAFPVTVTNPNGATSNGVNFGVNAPSVPTITSIVPQTVAAGAAAFTLTVNGTNFSAMSTVQWNGTARTTQFVNSTQLTASISASDVATQGSAQVTVNTPGAGGGTSNAVTFTITANGPVAVSLVNFAFSPNDITVVAGQTVKWTHMEPGVTHSVTRDITTVPGPDSPDMNSGDTYNFTVPLGTPSGTNIFYHCRFHGTAGDGTTFGNGMTGVIRVK